MDAQPPWGMKQEFMPEVQPHECPRVRNPFPDCYCLNMTSASIPMVVYFCREHFAQCPIYLADLPGP